LEKKAEINENNEKSRVIYHKIGHALHVLNDVFQTATYSDATKARIIINKESREPSFYFYSPY
jgi:F0F1-type ATP synthase alpha subunit